MKKYKKVNIGLVSSGTMRKEDLIPAFVYELKAQTPTKREHLKLCREIESNIEDVAEGVEEVYYESEESSEHMEELFQALSEYAPPYMYFGSHPGDGADFGFWLYEDWKESMEQDEVLILSMDDVLSKGYTGEVLEVNDHGNLTLYKVSRGRRYQIWSLV